MPRSPRKRSESDIYHVIVRGEGRRILFEDDEDRACFVRMLAKALDSYGATAYAWCLMSNHVHMLVKVDFDKLPRMMRSITSGFAGYYNKKHDHVGHVFAGRYNSKPVESDEYFLQVMRYIHLNPVKDGLSRTCAYAWSSYEDCLNATGFVDAAFVQELCGGRDGYRAFHKGEADEDVPDVGVSRARLSDDQALAVAKAALEGAGLATLGSLASLNKADRNAGIAVLRRAGLSARQVERFTGISRGIVERVTWR